nr:hypothetical protein [Tanacetum cinerariifolium]
MKNTPSPFPPPPLPHFPPPTPPQLVSVEPSVDCPIFICGNIFEFGQKEFCLITGFLFGKLPKKETYKGIPSSHFLDRIFPDRCTNRVKKVKGDEFMILFTTDDLWFGISDHDVVRVCLLLVATIAFMGREARIFYLKTLNVVPQKNESDCKKDNEKVLEPPKKKKKPAKEKELDIVKDRITILEKCFKLRYHDTSEDYVKQGSVGFNDVLDLECKDHQLNDNVPKCLVKPVAMMCGEVHKSDDKLDDTLAVGVIVHCGSISFDGMLDPSSKDHLPNDNVPKGLVKSVDMMCGEDNISDDKLDEKVVGGVIVDRSTLQASLPPNALESQEPKPTDKMIDPGCKDQPLNDNVPKGLVKLVDTKSGEDNISDYKVDETVVGGVIVDRSTLQESPPPNAMQYHQPHITDKVDAAIFVDVQVDSV